MATNKPVATKKATTNKQDSRWWLRAGSEAIIINASPEAVYGLVADLPRMGEWSP